MRGKRNRKAPEETPKRNKPKKPKAKPFFTYTVDQMVEAVDAVKGGRLKINAAAKAFKVPRSTLENKVKGTSPMIRKMGPSSILTAEEEGILVAWIIQCSRAGFPISKLELIDSAQRLIKELKRDNPFTDGRPGRKWYDAFLARHPEISLRVPQNLTSSRATVTKEALIKWHGEIEAYLKEIHSFDILKDKNRVWNADEAAFFLNPKGSKVLVSRGNKSVYSLVNTDEKENLTVLFCANASGLIAPPLIVYKYERIPKDIAESTPNSWGLGRSPNGWMTAESFYEYIANVFHKFLVEKNVPLPVILFIDGHSSHQSLHLSQFCEKFGIILVALYPNSTHLIQPMDVAVFRTLKAAWKEETYCWRMANGGANLKKSDFCPLLKKAIELSVTPLVLENGFRKAGLHPWDINAVDFSKILMNSNADESVIGNEEKGRCIIAVSVIEKELGPEKLTNFQKLKLGCDEIEMPVEDKNLFKMWASLKDFCNPSQEKTDEGDDLAQKLREASNLTESNEAMAEKLTISNNLEGEILQPVDLTDAENDDDVQFLNLLMEGDNLEKELASIMNTDPILEIESPSAEIDPSPNLAVMNKSPNIEMESSSAVINTSSNLTVMNRSPDLETESSSAVMNEAAVMNKAAVKSNSPKVPTPFKKALFWPALRADDKKKRRKTEKIPSVISSAAWQTYYARSAEKKKQAEELQAKKKREREEIKEKKKAAAEQLREKRRKAAEERKQKPKPSKRAKKDISPEKEDVNSDCSDAVDTPSSPSSKHDDGVDRDQIQMNSYVIVNYEGELFPGQVIAKKSNGATVKVMTMAGNGWKWPDKDDILFYNFCDIEAIIEPPTLQNSRGVCSVPEILKCKKKLHF